MLIRLTDWLRNRLDRELQLVDAIEHEVQMTG